MTESLPTPWVSKLDEQGAALAARFRLPGLALGVVCGDGLAWSGGYGFADIASARRPDADTLFRVGSITKTVTATAIMQLRDLGKLRLDDPVARHLPEAADIQCRLGSTDGITLRRLLTHHSGLVGEPPLDHWETLVFPSMAEVLACLPRTAVVIEQDSDFKYSNLAFTLLGEVVTRASGRPYEEYVRDEILLPLGMDSSVFELTDALAPRMATGYDPAPYEDMPRPAPHRPINGMASAGQLYSSVADLAKWLTFQVGGRVGDAAASKIVLSDRSLAEMHRPLYLEPGWEQGYGLAWWATRRGDNVYFDHGGGIHGFISQVYFHKPTRTGAVVLTNSGGHAAPAVIGIELMELVVAAEKERAAKPVERGMVPTPLGWEQFLGRYVAGPGGVVHIECRGGRLLLALPSTPNLPAAPPARLEPTAEADVFMCQNGRYAGEALTFRLSPGGAVTGFAVSGFPFVKQVLAGE